MAEAGREWMWGGVVLASLLARPAWAEMPVTFPPGWTVSDLPGPTVDGHVTPGGRRRAVLPDAGGKLVAVIELTEEQLTGGQVADLPEVVSTARETMVTDYTAAGLDDRCADPVPVRAGRWDGMQLDCTVFRHDVPRGSPADRDVGGAGGRVFAQLHGADDFGAGGPSRVRGSAGDGRHALTEAGRERGRREAEPWNAATTIIVVVGCVFLGIGAWTGWRAAVFLSAAIHVPGTVSDTRPHPGIRFTTRDGQSVEFQQNGFVSRPVGAAVPVAYLPGDPAGTAQADTFWADWGEVLGFLWIGLGFTVLPALGVRAQFRGGRW